MVMSHIGTCKDIPLHCMEEVWQCNSGITYSVSHAMFITMFISLLNRS